MLGDPDSEYKYERQGATAEHTIVYYKVGSIEYDIINDFYFYWVFPVPKADLLSITYSEAGDIVMIETTS